jgi:ATP-dependent exoDNAse (exonuclease V) alpha subunit
MAQDYCKQPTNTLVISPANRERAQLNSLIHQQLQREGKVSRNDHQMNVYVNRQDMTGTERTFANAYRPEEDIIRYNRASKVYKVKPGDYASVIGVNHERNELTVRFANGRTLTYDPTRLSGVSVYNKTERSFAEGDRIQFRAPFAEKRIVNGELGSITKIEPEHLRVALDSGREVSFDPQQFRHIDHGYAVTSHSSQGLTVDRVLINADTRECLRRAKVDFAFSYGGERARHMHKTWDDHDVPRLSVELEDSIADFRAALLAPWIATYRPGA